MNYRKYFIILSAFGLTAIAGQLIPCTTPNGEDATCISLGSCPVLLEAFGKDTASKKFVEASACPEGMFMVCCGKSGNFTQNLNKTQEIVQPVNESSRDYIIRNKVLPSKIFCGMQHTDDYFYNETETSVDEFPWLVYMGIPGEYDDNYYSELQSNCVGVLISNRFVLTSYSDCLLRITKKSTTSDYYIYIKIGQHHIYKDVNCIPTRYNVDDCTQPIINAVAYGLEPIEYDIAIIVLLDKIEFSDNVRPICLPEDDDDIPKPGDTVFTSGWGEDPFAEGKNVTVKKRITYTVMGDKECEKGNSIINPICGIPSENNTHILCPSDNGGPLMYKHNNNWILAGIVSKTTSCDDVHPVVAKILTADIVDYIYYGVASAHTYAIV